MGIADSYLHDFESTVNFAGEALVQGHLILVKALVMTCEKFLLKISSLVCTLSCTIFSNLLEYELDSKTFFRGLNPFGIMVL